MENRVPLPTDNIFKFYALFGLLIVIFGIGSILYVTKVANNLVFQTAVEIETLKANPVRSVSEEVRLQVLQRQVEIAIADKKVYARSLGAGIGIGILMMFYGFRKWHLEIQPVQDEIARLSLEKLRQEVEQGKNEAVSELRNPP